MSSDRSISESEGSLLAGFLEGEIHLGIAELNGGQSLSCLAAANVRDDDFEILEWLLALTGVGCLHRVPAARTSKPQVRWRVVSQSDCSALAAILRRFPFHGRKRAELDVWSAAVKSWSSDHGSSRRAALRSMKTELEWLRRYAADRYPSASAPNRRALRGYISGFLLAEGHLALTPAEARAVVNLRADDLALLTALASESGLGRVRTLRPRPPANPVARWTIASQADLRDLGSWLLEADLPGRKGKMARIWADGVMNLGDSGRRLAAADRLAVARRYTPPTKRDLLVLPRRDLTEACLDALRTWAASEEGTLSCVGYVRWRDRNAGHPTRNTIASRFGNWHRALDAAGLSDRAARAARPAGGAERRRQRREGQRARIISAVRRFEREHGRLPRATEFFRWRLESAPDSPTQATIYKLFPGGWTEVCAQVAAPLQPHAQAAGATV